MDRLEKIQEFEKLNKRLKNLETRFVCPFAINKDFTELVDCVFSCLETNDKILIHKSSQTMVTINDTVLNSDAFPKQEKYQIFILINILAGYCAQRLFMMD